MSSGLYLGRFREWAAGALRQFAYLGARHGPRWWLRYSPGPIGVLAYTLSRVRRRALAERLSWVLERPAARREVLQSFVNFARCFAEALGVEGHPIALETPGAELLHQELASGQGAILLTAHTGAWELVAAALRKAIDQDVLLVMDVAEGPAARRVHERLRGRSRLDASYVGNSPFLGLELRERLLNGGVIAFQMDRPPRSGRILKIRCFGRPFALPEGPFALARYTGAPLVPVFCSRLGFLRHRVEVMKPTRLERHASRAEQTQAAQQLATSFESFVRNVPTQWFDFTPPSPHSPEGT